MSGKQDDKLNKIQEEIDRTKGVMKQNIDKTIQRGERLEQLEDKADTLNNRAKTFQSSAKQARRQFCWQNWRNLLIILIILIIIIVVLYFILKKD